MDLFINVLSYIYSKQQLQYILQQKKNYPCEHYWEGFFPPLKHSVELLGLSLKQTT